MHAKYFLEMVKCPIYDLGILNFWAIFCTYWPRDPTSFSAVWPRIFWTTHYGRECDRRI